MTHVEQYHQKRLAHVWGGRGWLREWTDEHGTMTFKKATTHNAYLRQPWEVEARKRATEFVNKYFSN